MPHTKSRYMQDMGFADGRIFLGPGDLNVIQSSGTIALTRNAAGDISYNLSNSTTAIILANVSNQVLRRLGFFEDLQEQFGGAGISGSAEYQGRPDALASMALGQPITPRTAFKIKGYKLLGMDVIYFIAGASITTNTIRIDEVKYVNNIANAITSVLANGANGLQTATQANPYITNVPLAAGQQIYRNAADESLWIEINMATPGGGTARLYGIDLAFEFNFN